MKFWQEQNPSAIKNKRNQPIGILGKNNLKLTTNEHFGMIILNIAFQTTPVKLPVIITLFITYIFILF